MNNIRAYEGTIVRGLLFTFRMVQGVFDDGNPETVENSGFVKPGARGLG